MSFWTNLFGGESPVEESKAPPKKQLTVKKHSISPASSLYHLKELPLFGRLSELTFNFRTPIDPNGHRLLINDQDVGLLMDTFSRQFTLKAEGQSDMLAFFKTVCRSPQDLIYDKNTLDNSLNFDRLGRITIEPQIQQEANVEYHSIDGHGKYKGHTFHPIRTFHLPLDHPTTWLRVLDSSTKMPLKAHLQYRDKILRSNPDGKLVFDRIDPWVIRYEQEDTKITFEERQASVNLSCLPGLLLILEEDPLDEFIVEQESWEFNE